MNETIISIKSWEPLTITWPDVEEFTGDVHIQFPQSKIDFKLTGLLGMIPDLVARSEGQFFGAKLSLGENVMTTGEMMDFLKKGKDHFKELHRIQEEVYNKAGLELDI